MSYISPRIRELQAKGVHLLGAMDILTPELAARIAQDAEPVIQSSPNAGIPTYLNTYVDPKTIEVLFSPNKIAEIVGDEVQKGSWVTPTAVFIQTESTGEVSTYGDFNQNGVSGVNVTFPYRQNYVFQTMATYGDREVEEYGLARVNLVNEKTKSAYMVLNKFTNLSYAFGVAGMVNYGLLNDPSLSAALTPAAQWSLAATTGTSIYNDILAMFFELQTQTGGLIEMTDPLTLAMSPTTEVNLLKLAVVGGATPTGISTNVIDLLKKAFPALVIKTAVQYATTGGQLVQMIAPTIEGQRTASCAYSEKLRSHRLVQQTTGAHQKMTSGTFGTVIYKPIAIAQMLGV